MWWFNRVLKCFEPNPTKLKITFILVKSVFEQEGIEGEGKIITFQDYFKNSRRRSLGYFNNKVY